MEAEAKADIEPGAEGEVLDKRSRHARHRKKYTSTENDSSESSCEDAGDADESINEEDPSTHAKKKKRIPPRDEEDSDTEVVVSRPSVPNLTIPGSKV